MAILRLDKMLSHVGYGSRKEIKLLLREGIVTVDGEIAARPEMKIDTEKQTVVCDGNPVAYDTSYRYYMMNKPAGVISASYDPHGEEETVIDLLDDDTVMFDLFPVGRLDKDTVGLLLLTNDGLFAHRALSPKKHVAKTYYATLSEDLTTADVDAFLKGVALDDGYTCLPATLNILCAREAEVVIMEGKYHQVKRMFAARGKTVLTLQRTAFGSLPLDPALEEGEYRPLTDAELETLGVRPSEPIA